MKFKPKLYYITFSIWCGLFNIINITAVRCKNILNHILFLCLYNHIFISQHSRVEMGNPTALAWNTIIAIITAKSKLRFIHDTQCYRRRLMTHPLIY